VDILLVNAVRGSGLNINISQSGKTQLGSLTMRPSPYSLDENLQWTLRPLSGQAAVIA